MAEVCFHPGPALRGSSAHFQPSALIWTGVRGWSEAVPAARGVLSGWIRIIAALHHAHPRGPPRHAALHNICCCSGSVLSWPGQDRADISFIYERALLCRKGNHSLEELTSVPARGKHRISPSSHRITAGKARITSHATSPFAHPCVNLVAGGIKNNVYIIGINWHRNAEGKGELRYSGAVQHRSGCPQGCHCPLLVRIFLRKKGWIWLILEDTRWHQMVHICVFFIILQGGCPVSHQTGLHCFLLHPLEHF